MTDDRCGAQDVKAIRSRERRQRLALAVMAVILLANLVGCAASQRTVNVRLQTDAQVERRAGDRYRGIVAKLQPSAQEKLGRASRSFIDRFGQCPDAEDAAVLARQEVERAFDRPSETQADLLALGVLSGVSLNVASGRLDQLGGMDEMTQMRLQMAMDRRSKFMSTLSNLLKKLADINAAVVQNLK